MLTCKGLIELVLDYLDETLSPEAVAEFERHLQDCAPCMAYLRTYQRTRQLTGAVTWVEMPDEVKARLRALLVSRLGSGKS
jgi:anti-sigma factor RsiW